MVLHAFLSLHPSVLQRRIRAECYLQHIVAGRVAEVPHADLRAHVPATEGTGSELQAADLQHHV